MAECVLLTLRDVERRLGLTRWTLYDMIRANKLPAIKLRSGHYRVPLEAVDRLARGDEAEGVILHR